MAGYEGCPSGSITSYGRPCRDTTPTPGRLLGRQHPLPGEFGRALRRGTARLLGVIVEPFQVALSVADALERCGVPYVVGGSLASSVSGEPRSTLDIDLVVAMTEADVKPFLATLGGSFHADDHALRRAVRQRSTVNLFHRATATKVDLFMAGGSPLDRWAMRRRVRLQVASGPDRFLYVYTPEDILLQELRWYRLGGEVSDRQLARLPRDRAGTGASSGRGLPARRRTPVGRRGSARPRAPGQVVSESATRPFIATRILAAPVPNTTPPPAARRLPDAFPPRHDEVRPQALIRRRRRRTPTRRLPFPASPPAPPQAPRSHVPSHPPASVTPAAYHAKAPIGRATPAAAYPQAAHRTQNRPHNRPAGGVHTPKATTSRAPPAPCTTLRRTSTTFTRTAQFKHVPAGRRTSGRTSNNGAIGGVSVSAWNAAAPFSVRKAKRPGSAPTTCATAPASTRSASSTPRSPSLLLRNTRSTSSLAGAAARIFPTRCGSARRATVAITSTLAAPRSTSASSVSRQILRTRRVSFTPNRLVRNAPLARPRPPRNRSSSSSRPRHDSTSVLTTVAGIAMSASQ